MVWTMAEQNVDLVATKEAQQAHISDKLPDSSEDDSSATSGDSSSDDETDIPPRRNSMQNRDMSRGLKLEKMEVGEVVQLQHEDVQDLMIPAGCLMGYIVGKRTEEADLEELRKDWNISFQFRRHPSGWTIFKFDDEKQKHEVLTNGPYFSSGFPWVIKEIPVSVSINDESLCFIPVWITMPGLPLECWNEKALSKITSPLGNPIATDHCTAKQMRISFARVLVEVDARKPLVREVPIKFPNGVLHNQGVHYEFEPRLCSTCHQIGHSAEKWKSFRKPMVNAQPSGRSYAAAVKGSYAAAVKKGTAQLAGTAGGTKAKPTVKPLERNAEETSEAGMTKAKDAGRSSAEGTSNVGPKDTEGTSNTMKQSGTAEKKVAQSARIAAGSNANEVSSAEGPSKAEMTEAMDAERSSAEGTSNVRHKNSEGTSNAKASSAKVVDPLAKQKYTKANEASSGRGSVIDEITRYVQMIDYSELQDSDVHEKNLASYIKGKLKQNQASTSTKRKKKVKK